MDQQTKSGLNGSFHWTYSGTTPDFFTSFIQDDTGLLQKRHGDSSVTYTAPLSYHSYIVMASTQHISGMPPHSIAFPSKGILASLHLHS